MKRKALSVLLAVLMLVSAVPFIAFAEDTAAAKLGEEEYLTLEEAIAAVPADGTEATVTLLKDSDGNGIIIKEGQNIVIDFGGFTYTADGQQVGSAGTQTLTFQLLKGAKVTLKNGTLTSTKTKMLVQNYADLTLEDMVLDGTKSDVNQYTLSNNFGDTVIKGETKILGDEDTVAFDLWYGMFEVYDEGLSVTFDESFSGEVKGAIEYGAHSRVTADNWQKKASLVIRGGSFEGDFVATSDTLEEANIIISGGTFSVPVLSEYCPYGYEPCELGEGKYGVNALEMAAKLGEEEYLTLEEAIAAVPADGTEATVTLLKDSDGNGIIIKEGQNIVIDFGGFTYTADGQQVGSAGTQTLTFQLLKGAKVTLKNGTLTSTKTKMLVQNYADLTLEDMVLDGTKSDVNQYTLSNNFGDTVIKGETKILGDEDTVAFDLWYGMFEVYDEGLSVTFDESFSGEVKGAIEYGAHSRVTADNWQKKASLVIRGGSFEGDFVATSDTLEEANIIISGGTFSVPVLKEHCDKGYDPYTIEEGKYGVCNHPVKRVTESKDKTCFEEGYDKIQCTNCDYTIIIRYLTAGHDFSVYTSDNNATYLKDGTKTSVCGYEGCEETHTVTDEGSRLLLKNTSSISASQTSATVTLKWKAVEGATGYRVFIRDGEWVQLAETSALTYKISGLASGTQYKFAVRAFVEGDGEKIIAPSFKTITTTTKPAPPKTVKASATTSTSVTLKWSACTGATGYRVYIKTADGWKTVKTTTGRSYTVTGLDNNTKYTFAVKPYKKYDSKYYWAPKYTTFSVSTPYFDVPVLKVASTAKGRLTAAWGDVDGESGYQLYYSTKKSSGFKKLDNYKANTTKVYETGFESGTTYYYKVRAYTKVSGKYVYSDFSAVKSVKIK